MRSIKEMDKRLDEREQEIERLNNEILKYQHLTKTTGIEEIMEENEQLHSIIKEAREYITSQKLHKFVNTTGGLTYEERKLLEILDKVEENKYDL